MAFDAESLWGLPMKECAYQIAWAVMRGELDREEVVDVSLFYFQCVRYDGLVEQVYANLDGALEAGEAVWVLKGEALRNNVGGLLVEERESVLKAMFRKEFVLNPDPAKKAWHAFLHNYHCEIGDGSVVSTTDPSWDFEPEDGPASWELRDEAARLAMLNMPIEELRTHIYTEWAGCCKECEVRALSLAPPGTV